MSEQITPYTPNHNISAELRERTVVMLVGPSAIGKSALMSVALEHESDMARVKSFTTRAPRPDDEMGLYHYISQDTAKAQIASREAVQYIVHPTTGDIYGSNLASYPADFNLLDTLSGAVALIQQLPFKRALTVSVVSPADQWRERFLTRFQSHPN